MESKQVHNIKNFNELSVPADKEESIHVFSWHCYPGTKLMSLGLTKGNILTSFIENNKVVFVYEANSRFGNKNLFHLSQLSDEEAEDGINIFSVKINK